MIAINDNEIHLWYAFDIKSINSETKNRFMKLINQHELDKYNRFYFDKDRNQFLLTRVLVRNVLSKYVPIIKPQEWRFKSNYYGKPKIDSEFINTSIKFNLSHTKDFIVMAITNEQEIGIDVEYINKKQSVLDMAKRFFSPLESKHLFELPKDKQFNRFFDLWTLKEAYIKACGMGLSIPLDHFSYTFNQCGNISIKFHQERIDQPEKWKFWQVKPNQTHKLSMALKSNLLNSNYLISMREFLPSFDVKDVSFPISHGSIFNF